MCGIAGIWHLNNECLQLDKLKHFTDSMAHRGPDGAGYKILDDTKLGFGHRRLSILDLSNAGTQPMSFADERYWITFNGEIYNFIEIREELKLLGYTFKTDTDTEVILAAYHQWKSKCLDKFNGMFAFAIYDSSEKTIFIARDRFGVKPFYYTYIPNKIFAFASETIAFKALDGFERQIDDVVLLQSIHNPNSIEASGYTLYKKIEQLPAGCTLYISKKHAPRITRWWDTFEHTKQNTSSFENQVEEFKSLFENACKIRLRSDVPLASALSGGVDSSSVYCMLHHLMQRNGLETRAAKTWQKAFVATFPGTPQDEKAFAEQVIDYTKGDVLYIEPNYTNLVNDITASTLLFDNITGTPISVVSQVYKAMRSNGIIVSMDGHGADELMFGYRASVAEAYYDAYYKNDYSKQVIEETYLNLFTQPERELQKQKLHKRAQQIQQFNIKQIGILPKLKSILKSRLTNGSVNFIEAVTLSEWHNHKVLQALSAKEQTLYKYPNLSNGDVRLANDFHKDYIPYNLRDFDRASMQHGIEIRMPFMDYRLVSFLFSLPTTSKLGHGYTKLILREAMKGIMPETIRTRKLKIGLSAPITNWFNNQLSEFVLDTVNSTSFLQSPYWNGKLLNEFATHKTKTKDWKNSDSEAFWNIVNAHILLNHAK